MTLSASEIVAAGRDPSDGTAYVLTESSSELRLFVASSDTLNEVFEAGTGEGSDASGRFWIFDYNDDDQLPVNVEVQQDTSGARRMGVVKGELLGKGFDVGSMGAVLDTIDAGSAALMPAQSTQTFHVEFSGSDDSGHDVVVIAPDHARTFDGFRVFYGLPGALAEQSGTVSVSRGLSLPSITIITFTLGGSAATLQYGDDADQLTVGASTVALTASADSAVPDGAAFQCLP